MEYPNFCQSLANYQTYIEQELQRQKLPSADPKAVKVSYQLAQKICQQITLSGAMDFSDFMQLALYEPETGYYSSGNQKFGAGGDFVTAPEISSLFAQCFAHQFVEAFAKTSPNILELGAGSGIFAADCLLELERLSATPPQYSILEVSAELRARQQATIKEKAPHLLERVQWLDALPNDFKGVIFANEVVDAIPVECYRNKVEGIEQAKVSFNDNGFVFDWRTAPDLNMDSNLAIGQQFEQRPQIDAWVKGLLDSCKQALLVMVDYGYSVQELLSPSRPQGTLQHYYRHHKTDNPLSLVGMQDLTSSVNFTQLALAADKEQAHLIGYSSQAMFLMAAGIEKIAQQKMEHLDASDTMHSVQIGKELKHLLMPDEMGETCKVLAFSKGIELELNGFMFDNQLYKL